MTVSIPKARQVRQGERPSARNTNRYAEALEALQWLGNVTATRRSRPWARAMLHRIVVVQADYLECVRVWVRKAGDPIDGTQTVYVARPQRLRAEPSRGSVTYTYTDPQARVATDGADSETQIVTPTYLVGDLIEVRVSRGRTGVPEVDAQRGSPMDANVDGRAWAAIPV